MYRLPHNPFLADSGYLTQLVSQYKNVIGIYLFIPHYA
ncbi:hypothetical protein C427_2107 [Paraglaciecola psychrophila 170]|uniref:Uncharacterized protein n=1 Tax=Paraglaciecola psychrophila 170 TaxID=1129794 RepID=K7AZA0_9ALTE|nr:hypothetical protein C427_2107 [Paraglaciecola psychrophila 170]GAC40390.1 hypothetical protein GPSY_4788 [Paraglaciecola psychrophila 170]